MICHNCIHVINRSMGPINEMYHYCEIDGMAIINPIASCSRFDKVVVPVLPSVESVLETPSREPLASVENREGFQCDVCGKMLKTKLALVGHKRSHKVG